MGGMPDHHELTGSGGSTILFLSVVARAKGESGFKVGSDLVSLWQYHNFVCDGLCCRLP